MNEWVQNDAYSAHINGDKYARIDNHSRTQALAERIADRLVHYTRAYLNGDYSDVPSGVRVSVTMSDGHEMLPLNDKSGVFTRTAALQAIRDCEDSFYYEFIDSVLSNKNGPFKIVNSKSIILVPGFYRAKAPSINRGDYYLAEIRVERPIPMDIFFGDFPNGGDERVSFRKPNLPESTVTEAEGDPEAFRRAHGIAVDLAKSASAGDAAGVFNCFEELRGVVNRLTP